MLHPPPHIWTCLCDWSLQSLYLHYVTIMVINRHIYKIYKNQGGAALPPHWLRGPLPLSPVHEPQWHLVVTLAHAGSDA